MGLAGGKATRDESVMAMRQMKAIDEQIVCKRTPCHRRTLTIVYRLSLDFRSNELAGGSAGSVSLSGR